VFVNWDQANRNPDVLGALLEAQAAPEWRLALVTNRGVKVYPNGIKQTLCTDHWRCRFLAGQDGAATPQGIAALLLRLHAAGLDAVKTENLYTFDGVAGYSQAQGE
jgi:isocitrate dehydrogenase